MISREFNRRFPKTTGALQMTPMYPDLDDDTIAQAVVQSLATAKFKAYAIDLTTLLGVTVMANLDVLRGVPPEAMGKDATLDSVWFEAVQRGNAALLLFAA